MNSDPSFFDVYPRGKDKFKTRWDVGAYCGHMDETGEIIIGTSMGILKVRTIKRQSEYESRWDADGFNKVQGVPWEPIPARSGIQVRSKITIPDNQGDPQPIQMGSTKRLQEKD